jgi:F-type H+-transporting ATPase subunit b
VRIRVLLTGVGVAVLALLAWGAPAHAQSEEKLREECIHILEGGGNPDDCQEAPSPILPETSELVWGTISFVVLFGLLYKLAWPGVRDAMAARTERIRRSIDEAEQAKSTAESLLEDYQRQLADAKNEAGRIIEEARQTADAMRRDLQQRAEADIGEMRQRSASDIEAAKAQALADLRSEVADLAVGAAEVVVQRNLDRDTQTQLVEQYIDQVSRAGATR